MTPVCENCGGERWVCENHANKAWPGGCGCGAGMPCPLCNVKPDGGYPDLHPGATILCSIWDDEVKH